MNPEEKQVTPATKMIKCVVWDLDETLWRGVLLEDPSVSLREEAPSVIQMLDGRGILQSVASRNDARSAMAQLQAFGLAPFFLYPQIHWSSKVGSIVRIAELLNIGLDSVLFIDDQPAERDEVTFSLPQVQTLAPPADLQDLLDLPELTVPIVTPEAAQRRQMILDESRRQADQEAFSGPEEAFLATLGLLLTISSAEERDLERAKELTERTNQLNSTGLTYSAGELASLLSSRHHRLLIARLEDRYGSYGTVGLVLLECQPDLWTIKLLLTSCRVISRGVGTLLLNHVMRLALEAGVRLQADFQPTGRNRMMAITYAFAEFKPVGLAGTQLIFESDLSQIQPCPDFVTLKICPH